MLKRNLIARSSNLRPLLLSSAGTISLILGGTAHAQAVQSVDGPSQSYHEAQNTSGVVKSTTFADTQVPRSIYEPQVVVTPPNNPNLAAADTTVNGVGQMIVDTKDGFIGTCTGSLINPRTVIFAAHCVNESPNTTAMDPWGYGTGPGQLPIGFGFQANNNAPGNSAFGKWLNGVSGGQAYLTRVQDYMFTVNQVKYNPQSLDLGIANNFYQADVAIASLDTPAANVPTWAILLDPLPAPDSISNTSGTGYHVTIEGYGRNGVGTTGSTASDYRRRVAENYVGLLGSLDDIDLYLFGAASGHPQNLYNIDFDSPTRNAQYDFNVFKDNALPYVAGVSPGEGITAAGDSGGPLIVDRAFAKQVIIGVLSGGTRYFAAQPAAGYGTTSFYQPLYLFWDYIAASNPYHYVGAKAGNGLWTDASHWVTNLDPAYNILVNGQLVNGLPTVPGEGINGTSGKFGQVCFQSTFFGSDSCLDVATGIEYENGVATSGKASPDQTGAITNTVTGGVAKAGIESITTAQADAQAVAAAAAATALPAATLTNGLPGASNFVPNNVNPNAATKTDAQYFDVTLSAAGTTTLNSAVTIDRLTLNGAGAALTVSSGASLTSLINISQLDGMVTNNGTITSAGDYFLMTGGITGSGRFNAPYFTSVKGIFAPGTMGTTGTLTFGGNLIMASGSAYLVDLGSNGVSDKLAVVATTFAPSPTAPNTNVPVDGLASIGGTLGFASIATQARAGNSYTILTSDNLLSGQFATPSALSAILTPKLTYNPHSVVVTLAASNYANVVSGSSPVQVAYAGLLDRNRPNQSRFDDIYGPLDLQNGTTIRSTLEGLAPRTETLNVALASVATDNMARFYRDRLNQLEPGALGGTLALIGQPLQMAAVRSLPGQQQVRTDAGDTVLQEGKLPDTVSGFLAGGYIDGSSRPMLTAIPGGGRDKFDGFFLAAGLETEVGDSGITGLSFSFSKVNGNTILPTDTATGNLFQVTLYGKVRSGNLVLDAVGSLGSYAATTDRTVSFVGKTYRLHSNDLSLAYSAEVGVGGDFGNESFSFGPRIAARASRVAFGGAAEGGGGPALTYDRQNLDSLQARAGLTAKGKGTFRPYLSGYYVHDFIGRDTSVGANFVRGTGANALFALSGQDRDWFEVGGGITFASDIADISLGADTTISRDDVKNQSYRASVKFHF